MNLGITATIASRQRARGLIVPAALPVTLFGVACLVAVATILWLGRGATFFNDEWNLLETRSLSDPASWLGPITITGKPASWSAIDSSSRPWA